MTHTYAATYAAADAAARNDLIAALKGAREMSDDLVKRLRDCEFMGMPDARLDYSTAHEAAARIEELEAKLAKAVEVAEKSIKWLRLYGADVHREAATLTELTGGKA